MKRSSFIRGVIISIVPTALLSWVAGTVAGYYLPPYPFYGAGSLEGMGLLGWNGSLLLPFAEEYWMAGQVNPPGHCGFTFTARGAGTYPEDALDNPFIVYPDIGGGPGAGTSGGMMSGTPTDAPVGSYIVVYGSPVSSGYACMDEQGRTYNFVEGEVVRNPTLLPDPNLRRGLLWAVGGATCLIVFGLVLFVERRLARPSYP